MNDRQGHSGLVGAWRLLSWENQAAEGQVTYPMGADALGYLIYTADARFSVTISRANRPRFAAGDLLSGTTDEQAQAMQGFVAMRAATASLATGWCITWSCRCSPTGLGATKSGRSN